MTDSVRQILSEVMMRFGEVHATEFAGAVQLFVIGEGGGTFVLSIADGHLQVTEGQADEVVAKVSVSAEDLECLLRRRVSAVELVSEGRMRIIGSLPMAARMYVLISRAIRE